MKRLPNHIYQMLERAGYTFKTNIAEEYQSLFGYKRARASTETALDKELTEDTPCEVCGGSCRLIALSHRQPHGSVTRVAIAECQACGNEMEL